MIIVHEYNFAHKSSNPEEGESIGFKRYFGWESSLVRQVRQGYKIRGFLAGSSGVHDEWVAERLIFALVRLRDSVEMDKEIRGGIPVLKGTRISVGQLLADVANDLKISEIAEDWNIDIEIFRSFIKGLAVILDSPKRNDHLSIR